MAYNIKQETNVPNRLPLFPALLFWSPSHTQIPRQTVHFQKAKLSWHASAHVQMCGLAGELPPC